MSEWKETSIDKAAEVRTGSLGRVLINKLFRQLNKTYPQTMQTVSALLDENLFVSQYQTSLPSKEQLQAFLQNEKSKINDKGGEL